MATTQNFTVGYSLSSEEHPPNDLVRFAREAVVYGFNDIAISDHFHPWTSAQGHSPFVWNVLGAIAAVEPGVNLITAVTCPTIRIHPAIVAQAAATTAVMCDGGFSLGVGSGENLNEHIFGDRWPATDERLEMLGEAIAVMRGLWSGEVYSHRGEHYRVENAQLYTCPETPPPIPVSAFGPKAARFAAEHGDGLVLTGPDRATIEEYRAAGGQGPVIAATKVCWASDVDTARRTIHELWPNHGLPGELAQELATPQHFEQAVELVDVDAAVGSIPVGPDPEVHVNALRSFADAGVDRVHVHQIGTEQRAFLQFYRDRVLPQL